MVKPSLDYNLVVGASIGYRAREDKTMLRPGVLVQGSKNVLTNTAGRIASVKGYTLDGTASAVLAPIARSFDWETSKGYERNLRAGFLTTAGNDGKLQFRYVAPDGTITWLDLLSSLTSADFNFADFWDYNTEKIALLLMVNGQALIYEWSGAVTTVLSTTTNTITKEGATTWAEEGFYTAGTRKVTINGTEYAYTGGETTVALIGVTPTPVAVLASDVVVQTVRSTANGSMTGLPLPGNDLIGVNLNQIYVGSLTLNDVYVSKTNNYQDYSFSSPRTPGQGAIFNLGETPKGFAPQKEQMYIGTKNQWYQTKFTLSSDLTKESLEIQPLKTASKQGPMSQAFITKDKNGIVFLSNEPVWSYLGPVQNILNDFPIVDLSYPIVDDMNDYVFTAGGSIYWKNFTFVAVPQESLIRIFNQTNPQNTYWEAPVTYPISCFSIIDGDLYGHSFQTSESYKLFDGYNFNGAEIESIALFSFNNFKNRANTKGFNSYFVEGYISANTALQLLIQYEIDGCATNLSYDILGSDQQIVCIRTDNNSLGKNPLGSQPLGTNLFPQPTLPPKFRIVQGMPQKYFFEEQTGFYSKGIDQQWEIICHGPLLSPGGDLNNSITK